MIEVRKEHLEEATARIAHLDKASDHGAGRDRAKLLANEVGLNVDLWITTTKAYAEEVLSKLEQEGLTRDNVSIAVHVAAGAALRAGILARHIAEREAESS